MQNETERFNQLLECLRPFKWSLFLSRGSHDDFVCLYSDKSYTRNKCYRIYELSPIVRFLASRQNILNFSKNNLNSDNRLDDLCYIHRWNEFTRQVIIFHTRGSHHFDNYKLNDFLTLNDSFISKKFMNYYQKYQTNQLLSEGNKNELKVLPSL